MIDMPTLKAIHIGNYSRILNLYFGVRELTFRTSQRTDQSLPKGLPAPTLTAGRKKSTIAQNWLYVMRAKVLI